MLFFFYVESTWYYIQLCDSYHLKKNKNIYLLRCLKYAQYGFGFLKTACNKIYTDFHSTYYSFIPKFDSINDERIFFLPTSLEEPSHFFTKQLGKTIAFFSTHANDEVKNIFKEYIASLNNEHEAKTIFSQINNVICLVVCSIK